MEMPIPYSIYSKLKKALYGKVKDDVREIISTMCKYKNVDIIAGAVCVGHVHLILVWRYRPFWRAVT